MSIFSFLYIADYPFVIYKDNIYPESMTIFDEQDKQGFKRKISLRNKLVWRHLDVDEEEMVYIYSNSIKVIKQRLEVMGFSLNHAKNEFLEAKANELRTLKELDEEYGIQHSEALEKASFEDFIDSFRELRIRGLYNSKILFDEPETNLSELCKYMLISNNNNGGLFGFPCNNIRTFLRTVIESCPSNTEVVYDISNLVHYGIYEPDFEICNWEQQNLTENFEINSKAIILVEGNSDREILSRSLNLLYPYLASYYSFMDFQGSKSDGGASFLVTQIKHLVGAGVGNRVIALFDNDTAGTKEYRRLIDQINLPKNYKIFQYPNLEFASNYPTIGPTGIVNHNINGLGCSIELYLGLDVLKEKNKLIPVQWKGYEQSLKQYHAEIIYKDKIKKRFYNKLHQCETDKTLSTNYDWSGIELILEQIFDAFC